MKLGAAHDDTQPGSKRQNARAERTKGFLPDGLRANLLQAAQQHAKQGGAASLFVLTTQTQEWFEERGFHAGDVKDLPETKQSLYNWQRGSKVLLKTLD